MNDNKPEKRKLKYGIIGVGQMGRDHIRSIELIDSIEIAAIADSNEENLKLAAKKIPYETAIYSDYKQLLDENAIDTVIIATPTFTHAKIACLALEKNLNVLCEKPMALTLSECNNIQNAANRSSGVFQIGLELRYLPEIQKAYSIIQSEQIGQIRQLWCKEFRGPFLPKVDQWIIQQDKSGGALLEKNCHHFDLFNWYTGSLPRYVSGFGSRDLVYGEEAFGIEPSVIDSAHVTVQYDDGAVGTIMLCLYCSSYEEGLEIGVIGTKGWLEIKCLSTKKNSTLRIGRTNEDKITKLEFSLPKHIKKTSHCGAVYHEHIAFLENILQNRNPLTGADEGLLSCSVALAAEETIKRHCVIPVESASVYSFP